MGAENSRDKGLTRREAVKKLGFFTLLLALPTGCTRHRYVRPATELDLGPVKDLLYSRTHLRSQAVLVIRDVDGWAALSTRCTYIGCDLTYQEPILFCPCCQSRFDLEGNPLVGSTATERLPWFDLFYKQGNLWVNTDPARIHKPDWRFTTQEIEDAIREVKERVKVESITDGVKIPKVLLGEQESEMGGMFLEDDANVIDELKMIK